MKTGVHPMKTKLKLFLDWGITFDKIYETEEKSHRKVYYADKEELEENIVRHTMALDVEYAESKSGLEGVPTCQLPSSESRNIREGMFSKVTESAGA